MKTMTVQDRGFYLTVFSLGFYLGYTSKSWWALVNSLVTVLVIWTVFFIFRRIAKVYKIGYTNHNDKK